MVTAEQVRLAQYHCSTRSNRVGPEVGLSRDDIRELVDRIEERLYDSMSENGGTCFGIDLPTMLTSHPRQARVRHRLIQQFSHATF